VRRAGKRSSYLVRSSGAKKASEDAGGRSKRSGCSALKEVGELSRPYSERQEEDSSQSCERAARGKRSVVGSLLAEPPAKTRKKKEGKDGIKNITPKLEKSHLARERARASDCSRKLLHERGGRANRY